MGQGGVGTPQRPSGALGAAAKGRRFASFRSRSVAPATKSLGQLKNRAMRDFFQPAAL